MSEGLRLTRPSDVDKFERMAGAFLLAREAENCVILGLCSQMRTASTSIQNFSPYFAVVHGGEGVVGAALIAGYLVLLSSPIDVGALPLLVADIAAAAPAVPGVVAEPTVSRRFAELWTSRTGRPHRLNMQERVFRTSRVIRPQPAVEGSMRAAAAADRELLAQWLQAFTQDALGQGPDLEAMRAFADRWIARDGRAMYFWTVDGAPVSMAGTQGDTPNGIRIGAVYTPPHLRGRGYASAITASVTQAQLDSRKRYCFLFTDLANPTSNKIYQAIGYEPVADAADYRFDPPD